MLFFKDPQFLLSKKSIRLNNVVNNKKSSINSFNHKEFKKYESRKFVILLSPVYSALSVLIIIVYIVLLNIFSQEYAITKGFPINNRYLRNLGEKFEEGGINFIDLHNTFAPTKTSSSSSYNTEAPERKENPKVPSGSFSYRPEKKHDSFENEGYYRASSGSLFNSPENFQGGYKNEENPRGPSGSIFSSPDNFQGSLKTKENFGVLSGSFSYTSENIQGARKTEEGSRISSGSFIIRPENIQGTTKNEESFRISSGSFFNSPQNIQGTLKNEENPRMPSGTFFVGTENIQGVHKTEENNRIPPKSLLNTSENFQGIGKDDENTRASSRSHFSRPENFQGTSKTEKNFTVGSGITFNNFTNIKGNLNGNEMDPWEQQGLFYSENFSNQQDAKKNDVNPKIPKGTFFNNPENFRGTQKKEQDTNKSHGLFNNDYYNSSGTKKTEENNRYTSGSFFNGNDNYQTSYKTEENLQMPKGSFFSGPENYRETDKKNNNLRTTSGSNSNRNENYLGTLDSKYYPHMQEEPFYSGQDNYRGKPNSDEYSGKQSDVYNNNNYKGGNGKNVREEYPRKQTGSFYDPEKFHGLNEIDNFSTTSLGVDYNDPQNYKGHSHNVYNYEEFNEWDYRNHNPYDGNYDVYQGSDTIETNYYVPNDYNGKKQRNEDQDYLSESMYYGNTDSKGNNITKEDEELLKSFYNSLNHNKEFKKKEEKPSKPRDQTNTKRSAQQKSKESKISDVRKKFFDLNNEITEENLTEMVRSLDNIPTINDILHIWWQLREVERHKFAMMQYRLMKYIGHLTNTYDLNEDFAKDLWVAYSKYITTKLEKKENFYNKVFYSFIKRDAVTRHALECFLSDCIKSFHQYIIYLNKKCQDRIAVEVIERVNSRKVPLSITMGE
ncbi:EMP1-trafficking protein [Plasmodium sp. DRC-Itaito]|nr:EMP1-trafficking protein [Plasmodium sp. DRC-Itaito]